MEPLHIAVRLVERDVEPGRARVALQMAEHALGRLPKAPPGAQSYRLPTTDHGLLTPRWATP